MGEYWGGDFQEPLEPRQHDKCHAFIQKLIDTSYSLSSVSDTNSLGEEITSEMMTCNYCGADAAFFGWQNSIIHASDCLVLEAEGLLK